MAASKFNATEGAALKKAMNEFDEKLKKAKEDNDTKMTNLINERNKLEAEAAKLNEDYAQGLITSLNAQKKQEEIQTKAASWEKKMSDYQDSAVKEENKLVKEEKELNEKYMVLMNQFNKLASMAIDEINADNRYKMIVNAVSVVKADPSLNISDLVLERVDALFEAGALNL
jgi:outer membrane protein